MERETLEKIAMMESMIILDVILNALEFDQDLSVGEDQLVPQIFVSHVKTLGPLKAWSHGKFVMMEIQITMMAVQIAARYKRAMSVIDDTIPLTAARRLSVETK